MVLDPHGRLARAAREAVGKLRLRYGPGRLARERPSRRRRVVRLVAVTPKQSGGAPDLGRLAGDPGALEVMDTFAWCWRWAWPTWPTPSTRRHRLGGVIERTAVMGPVRRALSSGGGPEHRSVRYCRLNWRARPGLSAPRCWRHPGRARITARVATARLASWYSTGGLSGPEALPGRRCRGGTVSSAV